MTAHETIRLKHLLILATCGGVIGACTSSKDGAEPEVAWSAKPRSIAYQIEEKTDQTTRSHELTLAFGESDVEVTELGVSSPFEMTPSGRLESRDAKAPAVLFELIALSVLPPKLDALHSGQTWSYTRPDDEEAKSSDGIVAQERFDYTITQIDADRIVVGVKGYLRLAPSDGFAELVKKHGLPEAMVPAAGIYQPYVEGSAVFSRREGKMLTASGVRLPFAFITSTGDDVKSNPKAVTYSLTAKPEVK